MRYGFPSLSPFISGVGLGADNTGQILFAYEDERGEDVIEAIDFWKSQRKSEMYPGGGMGAGSPPGSSNGLGSRLGSGQ